MILLRLKDIIQIQNWTHQVEKIGFSYPTHFFYNIALTLPLVVKDFFIYIIFIIGFFSFFFFFAIYYFIRVITCLDVDTQSNPSWLEKIQKTVRNVLKAVNIFQSPVNQSGTVQAYKFKVFNT